MDDQNTITEAQEDLLMFAAFASFHPNNGDHLTVDDYPGGAKQYNVARRLESKGLVQLRHASGEYEVHLTDDGIRRASQIEEVAKFCIMPELA